MADVEAAPEDLASGADFQALLDAAVDGICVIDESGRIEQANGAAARLFGYSVAELEGQNISILMAGSDRAHHDRFISNYVQSRQAKIIGIGREVQGCHKDGSTFPLHLSVGEVKATARYHRHFVGIMRDLSVQKAAEERARQLQERLNYVVRFSVMGEMAAGLAHEINQPLGAIATYAQAGKRLTERVPNIPPELAEVCERINEQAQRAGQIIENLRGFVSKREVVKDFVDLNEALNGVLDLIVADAKSNGITISTELQPNLPKIMGDEVQLQQVILNLTRNAVDAMKNGVRKKEGIAIRTFSTGDSVGLSVTDHGHGVSSQLADSIFHPFVTTKGDGLGIGLAISRTIVSGLHGELNYRNNPDGGSIFEFVVPTEEVDE